MPRPSLHPKIIYNGPSTIKQKRDEARFQKMYDKSKVDL